MRLQSFVFWLLIVNAVKESSSGGDTFDSSEILTDFSSWVETLVPEIRIPKTHIEKFEEHQTATFSYDEADLYGPTKWNLLSAQCGGMRQTPINIETSTVSQGEGAPLSMEYFDKPVLQITATNNGHSVAYQLQFADNEPSRLVWNSSATYILDSLHMHWGNDSNGGSEHTVDGHRYAAELHLVHFNEKYGSVQEALNHADGLAVVGVFFELLDEASNDGSNKFTKFLSQVRQPQQSFVINDPSGIFTIRELIKNEVREFYNYEGSLTTPPCSEVVNWIVAKRAVSIFPSDLAEMVQILDAHNEPMMRNYRPIQDLNDRSVYSYN